MKRLFGITALCALVIGAGSASAQVSVYSHCGYQGPGVALQAGNWDLGSLQSKGARNDDISSIRVASGWRATVFEHGGFRGKSITLTADTPCLTTANFNDYISSIRVERIASAAGTPPVDEVSPTIPHVGAVLAVVDSTASTVKDTEIRGFVGTVGNSNVWNKDHPGGITMTASGRLVTSMAITGRNCGMLVWSDRNPMDHDNPGWNFKCILSNHPNSMQAVGEIVAVSHRGPSGTATVSFFKLERGDSYTELTHLKTDSSGAPLVGEGIGLTYDSVNNLYILFTGSGLVTPGSAAVTQYKTLPGENLSDEGTRFRKSGGAITTFNSGQGTNLFVDPQGTLHVASMFSSHNQPGNFDTVATCAGALIAGATVGGVEDYYHDVLTHWRSDGKVPFLIGPQPWRDIGITQKQCIAQRPSWRFAGAIVPLNDGRIAALWAGRWKEPETPLSDNGFEFAYQVLTNTNRPAAQAAPACNPAQWAGNWQTTYDQVAASILPDGAGKGDFNFTAAYRGTNRLNGKIYASDPCRVVGTWRYPDGKFGQFSFNLKSGGRAFEGTWTNGNDNPAGKAVNWTGTK